MDLSDYPEWREMVVSITDTGGRVVLIGGTDSGKTTFAALLANQAVQAARRMAVIDADLGQSEIGPPACVGMGLVSQRVRNLSEIEVARLWFVGGVSPRGCMLEHVVGVGRMAEAAAELETDLLVVDTTGFIQGPGAARLLQAKVDLVRPRHVVVLQRAVECEPIVRGLTGLAGCEVHRLPVSQNIARKPAAYRSQRRAARFAAYFRDSKPRQAFFDRISFTRTWLNSGAAVAPHHVKFLTDCAGTRVLHAEQSGRFLGLITERLPSRELTLIHEQFKPEAIAISPISRFNHLLVGLSTSDRCVGLGLITDIDFTRRKLDVLTPVRSLTNLRALNFGLLRLRPDGRELGNIKPGEV